MSKIVALAGPTAVGKTEFAIKLAEELDGEIVSCDSHAALQIHGHRQRQAHS